ncbi:O-antigen ligase family protein [Butyrivibrio sp. VCD2006]|uniref:O-antigen ligase family protein n=1 Tax=Butyrivibrio sp. VCD2006 TaxID=1280664 RepID=UPI00040D6FC1|nr:hypothetical protein [Butyrivibrio sp. VCD2006]
MNKKNVTTAEAIHGYGEIVAFFFLAAMLLVLPFYYRDGYADIANAKYEAYKRIAIGFIVGGGTFAVIETICRKAENLGKLPALPIICLFLHTLSNIVSFVFSVDRGVSWVGNGSWHMGLLSQILFLATALLVYYYYRDNDFIWAFAALGAGLTSVLTILNRFDIYPLDMGNKYPGFISTLGQTNWATMYIACLMGVVMGWYTFEEDYLRRMIVLAVNAVVFMGAWVIGSDTILPVMATELFIMFGVCARSREMTRRFSSLLIVFGAVTEVVWLLVFVLFHDLFVFVDEGDAVNSLLRRHAGIYVIAAAAVLWGISRSKESGDGAASRKSLAKNGDMAVISNADSLCEMLTASFRIMLTILLASLVLIILAMILVTNAPEHAGFLSNIRMLRFDYDWGTHRGLNWRCAAIGFKRLPFFRKLVGVGQGGFESYIYSFTDFSQALADMYGKYKLKVAHNEFLNFLIENGLLGCLSYMAFLGTSFASLWKRAEQDRLSLMALLSLAGYMACAIFFFQHVYATSFMYLFVVMALSKNK